MSVFRSRRHRRYGPGGLWNCSFENKLPEPKIIGRKEC